MNKLDSKFIDIIKVSIPLKCVVANESLSSTVTTNSNGRLTLLFGGLLHLNC